MGLLDLVLPPACGGCGTYGTALCRACRERMRPLSRAEDRFFAPDPAAVVGEAFVVALAAFGHRDETQRLLRRLKYGGGRRLADPLAAGALPAFRRLLATSGPAPLVPVPLHHARERERGYNQAHLLAVALARRTGLPISPALVRERATVRQHGLDRATRMRNLRDAMALRPPPGPMPEAVILVDDILTTGATFEASAAILRTAGVARVYGFAIAREV
jgi:ComF family protein